MEFEPDPDVSAASAAHATYQRLNGSLGAQKKLVYDREGAFVSELWRNHCSLSGTRLPLITACYHQSNGQIELVHGLLVALLKTFGDADQRSCDLYQDAIAFA